MSAPSGERASRTEYAENLPLRVRRAHPNPPGWALRETAGPPSAPDHGCRGSATRNILAEPLTAVAEG